MDQSDLQRFKRMLEESRKNIFRAAKKTRTEESTYDADDRPDEMDLASSESALTMTTRLRERERILLKKIDKALARIDAGIYGICEHCHEEIALKRLEARPVTTLCIRCKEEQERVDKTFN